MTAVSQVMKKLKELRLGCEEAVTQDDVAACLRCELKRPVNSQQVSRWETGRVVPRLDVAQAWAGLFGAELRLVTDTDTDKPIILES